MNPPASSFFASHLGIILDSFPPSSPHLKTLKSKHLLSSHSEYCCCYYSCFFEQDSPHTSPPPRIWTIPHLICFACCCFCLRPVHPQFAIQSAKIGRLWTVAATRCSIVDPTYCFFHERGNECYCLLDSSLSLGQYLRPRYPTEPH